MPPLGVCLLFGEDILTQTWNLRRKLEGERGSLVEVVAVKAG